MLDISQFIQRLANNHSVVRQVMVIFRDQYTGQTQFLTELNEQGNLEKLYQGAHSLKGALANMCAEDDASLAAQIELQARQGQAPSAEQLHDMEACLTAVLAQIEQYLAEH